MPNHIISYERARATGVLNAKNVVRYKIYVDGKQHHSFEAGFTFHNSVEETLAAKCCFLWDVAVFTPEGIHARVERDGCVALVVPGPGWELGTSALDGSSVLVEAKTPLCCDPRSETFWSM